MGNLSQYLKVDVAAQRHAASVDLQHFAPALNVRDANNNFAVKSSRATQSLIKRIRQIRGCNDGDLSARLQTIHNCQQLRDDSLFNLAGGVLPFWGDGIDFIK